MQDNDKIRVANVAYLNSAPYRVLKQLDTVDYKEVPPAECARMLHEDEADLALIPVAELFNHGGYHFLPFGIAARGPVESVHLFADCGIEELETILVDSASHSSVLLLRILLEDMHPELSKRLKFHRVNIERSIDQVKASTGALVIGDISLKLKTRFKNSIDLAELWHSRTALPFVFAVWAYHPGRLSADRIRSLESAIQTGLSQKEFYAREWAEEHDFVREDAEAYVNGRISYALDATLLAGAEEFRKRAAKLNLAALPPFAAQSLNGAGKNISSEKRFAARRTLDGILADAAAGLRISISEGVALAEQATLGDLALAADSFKRRMHSEPDVSYIIDRNINYTNVCNVYCRFCAFYRAPMKNGRASKKSEGGYLLSKEEIGQKIQETVDAGGVQILLQGGLNPELGIEYYEDLFRWIKSNYPINLHALSADEILHISKVSRLEIDEVFDRLIAAGLGSFPGGGAEILVDRVRQRIAKLKSPAKDWLTVHRSAHRKGLRSTCTMMFGVQETWLDRILHLAKLRTLQDETRGFTAFITWPFQDDNLKLERGNTTSPEYMRVQAVSRLFLDNIANVQSSWVTMGPSIGQAALFFGANDFGSVMFEENVVSAAGTTYCMDTEFIERHIKEAGFTPWRRDIHYTDLSQ